jgi:hypothetical protein
MEANANSPNSILTIVTIADLTSDPSLLERTVAELIPGLTLESDTVMQRTAVQSVVGIAKHDVSPVFHELAAGPVLITQSTNDIALQCRCLKALNADRIHLYFTCLIPMAVSTLIRVELMAKDDPELGSDLVEPVLDLARAGRCLEIAVKWLWILPQLQIMSSACLIEAMDLLELLMIAYPQEIVEFLQGNEAAAEILIWDHVM